MTLWHWFQEGGFIMYPLLFCSVLVWSVALEKIWSLTMLKRELDKVHSLLMENILQKKKEECAGILQKTHVILTAPYATALETWADKDKWVERVERKITEGQVGMKKNLWILGTIGNAAPFIGLFGTVIGIIRSFDSIAMAGKSGFAVVARGLSEALVATAAGIIVAVIAVIFYNFFVNKIQYMNLRIKNNVRDFMDHIQN